MPRLAPCLLVLLLMAFSATAQTPNATDAKGRKQGPWSRTWPNGVLRYTGHFVDDKPSGTFKHFDEKGRMITVQLHAGDGRISRAEHLHPNGEVMARGRYIGQEKDSTWNYYAMDGTLRKVERFVAGKQEGEAVSYYPNGQVAEKAEWQGGLQHGPAKSWFANGKLKSESNYVNGEPEGRMVFYYSSGGMEIEGNLVNGDREGTWFYYNTDGSIQLQVLYSKGQMVKEKKENGTFKEYHDDEQLKSEVTYRMGRREGRFAEYHANGRWVLKATKGDAVMGTPADMERVLEGQTKKREGTYVNDLLDGEVKEYDEKGKLVKVTRFRAGELQP